MSYMIESEVITNSGQFLRAQWCERERWQAEATMLRVIKANSDQRRHTVRLLEEREEGSWLLEESITKKEIYEDVS